MYIFATPNHDNPLMNAMSTIPVKNCLPVIGIDLHDHAWQGS